MSVLSFSENYRFDTNTNHFDIYSYVTPSRLKVPCVPKLVKMAPGDSDCMWKIQTYIPIGINRFILQYKQSLVVRLGFGPHMKTDPVK